MKRPAIADPGIVPLVGGEETPTIPTARAASPTDLRQTKVDEFIAVRSLKPKSEQAYRRDLQYFIGSAQQVWANVNRHIQGDNYFFGLWAEIDDILG
ncbi:hypothetical protein [Leptolyngbya sp. FACHB-16]|uniref:hypothetical protein n=1 Tax=unclassified Leptolyngbya TaxID=2650499 RepID=UPI0016834525|nr:hypothetical protein [Leptolyngbya sp. FACHB-16]MBD2155618.1 hypothetical protein [Leptolyngbya sp. FACHB-16]